ncbi:hypothetical protein AVEN_232498-1 [Araneus ventricosus]|uniref:Uncharacterized protein n=1 Tax=Araneus ventricosus TaxID=182803 RepID=A0A4Y2SH19_ARAVE|nr:hypothetical protein AVEN_232498-1 [Araneus ventricosus]
MSETGPVFYLLLGNPSSSTQVSSRQLMGSGTLVRLLSEWRALKCAGQKKGLGKWHAIKQMGALNIRLLRHWKKRGNSRSPGIGEESSVRRGQFTPLRSRGVLTGPCQSGEGLRRTAFPEQAD